MRDIVLVVPGRLDTRTGGSIYDRRMSGGLRQRGWSVGIRELEGSFPFPTPSAREHAAQVFASLRDQTLVLVDGLAFGAMPAVVEREAARLRFVALVHLPLAADRGLDRETADRLEAAERRALAAAALVIVTGASTLTLMAEHGLRHERIVVVEPGTDPAPLARGSGGSQLHLLSVATINPGKGHEILFRALATVPTRAWRLTCAGSLTRHPLTVERLRTTLRSTGLEDRVDLVGELDAVTLARCYDTADLFVLATLQETYGMAVAEALARGIPVISTTTGAIPSLVGDAAGLLVPPGHTDALTDALSRVLNDPGLRARLGEGARCVRNQLPTWERAFDRMDAVLARFAIDG